MRITYTLASTCRCGDRAIAFISWDRWQRQAVCAAHDPALRNQTTNGIEPYRVAIDWKATA